MPYWLTVMFFILILSAILALSLATFSWRSRHAGVWAYPFTFAVLAAGCWAFFYALELFVPIREGKLIWVKVQYVAIVFIPVSWFLFAMAYTQRNKWLSRNYLLPLLIVPTVTLVLVFTNDYHRLIWTDIQLVNFGALLVFKPDYGLGFWIYSGYSYFLLFWGTVVLIQAAVRFPRIYRWQSLALVVGVTIPWLANSLHLLDIGSLPNLDFSPIAFAVSGIVVIWSIGQFSLFDLVPLARREAVDMMRDGVIVLDNKNRVIDMNPASLSIFDTELADVIGVSIDELWSKWSEIVVSFGGVWEANAEICVESDVGKKCFALHITPLVNARKRVNGRLIVFHDITVYKQTEAALATARDQALAAGRVKTELLARVSHELQTPLNVILGFTELIQMGIVGPVNEKQHESLEKILESTRFLTNQVSDLLTLSSIEAGQTDLDCYLFPIQEVVSEVIGKCEGAANEKDLQIVQMNTGKDLKTAYGDQDGITQILTNLVENAIKFSEQGTIKVGALEYNDTYWALQVSDQGPGIAQEARDLIFEPFRQIDGSMTRIHGGTGLGLTIVKQMAELMGGMVKLESQLGQGSTFTVLLPNEPKEE
ncbi:MAG: hypothetical protein CSB13_02255 [Chloroflexi bacterium]|nr:MAG: hypothetical protein CSB13_02255 [Chloroflexota bacterium]